MYIFIIFCYWWAFGSSRFMTWTELKQTLSYKEAFAYHIHTLVNATESQTIMSGIG